MPAHAAAGEYVYASQGYLDYQAAGIAVEPSSGYFWASRPTNFQRYGTATYFDSQSYGNGSLSQGRGVALDSSGNVYIADAGANQVKVFNSSGSPIRSWPVGGQPYGIDLDGTGNVYVTDSTNNQVKKYTPLGGLIGTFGTFGAGSGQFNNPQGIGSGQEQRRRIRRGYRQSPYPEARLERQLHDQLGDPGHRPRAVRQHARADSRSTPRAMCSWPTPSTAASSDSLASGALIEILGGTKGTDAGQIWQGDDLAIDASGALYVMDSSGNRWSKWIKGGRVIVTLTNEPNDYYLTYPFTASGGLSPTSFTLDSSSQCPTCTPFEASLSAPAGSGYGISFAGRPGWEQASANCDDGSQVSNISLSLGETVNCHFHFRKLGKIVVVQESQPDGEPQDFSYTAGGGLSPASFTLDDDTNATLPNTQTYSDLQPGSSYSVMQPSTPAGWNAAQVTCSDGSSPSAIDVSYGETVTCTFANRLVDSGTITVKLDRQPDASDYFAYNTTGFGAAAPSSFYLQDDGNEGYEPQLGDLRGPSGFRLWRGSCAVRLFRLDGRLLRRLPDLLDRRVSGRGRRLHVRQ